MLLKHRNGERTSLANLKLTMGSLLACSCLTGCHSIKSLVGCLNLCDFLVDSLVLVDRLPYLVTANSIYNSNESQLFILQ